MSARRACTAGVALARPAYDVTAMPQLLSLVTALALAATLFHAGPQQAYACSCIALDGDETRVLESLDYFDVMVVGSIVSLADGDQYRGAARARVRVESSYKGDPPAEFTIRFGQSAACEYPAAEVGSRHFFALEQPAEPNSDYAPYTCSSFPMSYVDGEGYENFRAYFGTLARLAPPRPAPTPSFERGGLGDDDALSDDGPGWQVVVGASAVAVAVAVGAAVFWRLRIR